MEHTPLMPIYPLSSHLSLNQHKVTTTSRFIDQLKLNVVNFSAREIFTVWAHMWGRVCEARAGVLHDTTKEFNCSY